MILPLQDGRPADSTGRLEKELRVYDLLDSLGIAYQRLDHAPADTPELCADIDESLHAMICKNLLLCNRRATKFYLLMIPEHQTFQGKALSEQLGLPRLSFASEEHMRELLDTTPGSVSVMGLMNDTEGRVQLILERSVADSDCFGCHPCINTSSIRFSTADLLNRLLPAMHHTPLLFSGTTI